MEVPSDYKLAGILNLVSGGLNVFAGLVWTASLMLVCVGFVWLIPVGIGGWQIMVGMKQNGGKADKNAKNVAIAGIIAGVLNMNILSIICSVVALLKTNTPEIAGWIEANAEG